MVDGKKTEFDDQFKDEKADTAYAARLAAFIENEEQQARRQSNPDSAFLQAVQPSATEVRLIEIDRKLNAIMDHLGIPR